MKNKVWFVYYNDDYYYELGYFIGSKEDALKKGLDEILQWHSGPGEELEDYIEGIAAERCEDLEGKIHHDISILAGQYENYIKILDEAGLYFADSSECCHFFYSKKARDECFEEFKKAELESKRNSVIAEQMKFNFD